MTTPITQELEALSEHTGFDRRYDRFLIDAARLYFHTNIGDPITNADRAADLFDGNQAIDGYSLDAMFDAFREGMTPAEAVSSLPA